MGTSPSLTQRASIVFEATQITNESSPDAVSREIQEIFDELQNYDIPDSLLDRLEIVFNDFICLKQAVYGMQAELSDLRDIKNTLNYNKAKQNIEGGRYSVSNVNDVQQKVQQSPPLNQPTEQPLNRQALPNTVQPSPPIPISQPPPPIPISQPPPPIPISQRPPSMDEPTQKSSSSSHSHIPPPPPPPSMQLFQPSKYKKIHWTAIALPSTPSIFTKPTLSLSDLAVLQKFAIQSAPKKQAVQPISTVKVLHHAQQLKAQQSIRLIDAAPSQIASKLLSFDPEICTNQHKLSSLMRALPQPKEIPNLKKGLLSLPHPSSSESLILSLISIDNVGLLLQNYLYMCCFDATSDEFSVCIQNVSTLCSRLMSNKALKDFVSLLLSLGNHLNQSVPAQAFKVNVLNDLQRIKSTQDSSDLLQTLIGVFNVQTRSPYISSMGEHLLLQQVANSNQVALTHTCKDFLGGVSKLSAVRFSEDYQRVLCTFTEKRAAVVDRLNNSLVTMWRKLDECHGYFLENVEFDQEGRVVLFKKVHEFYEVYQLRCNKIFAKGGPRESRRYTIAARFSIKPQYKGIIGK